jgi:hypothetical protein
LRGREHAHHPGDDIVHWHAVLEVAILAQSVEMIDAEIFYFLPPYGAADRGHDGEKEDVRELVLHFPLLARITDDGEVLQEAESVHGDHLSLKRQHMITADIDRQSDPSQSRYFSKNLQLRCTTWLLVFKFLTPQKPYPIRIFPACYFDLNITCIYKNNRKGGVILLKL